MEALIILLQGVGLLMLVLIFRRLRQGRVKPQNKSIVPHPPAYYDTAGRARRYEGAGSRSSEGARDRSRDGSQPIDQSIHHTALYDQCDDDTRRSGGSSPSVTSCSSGDSYSSGGGYSGGGDSGGSSDGGGGGGE